MLVTYTSEELEKLPKMTKEQLQEAKKLPYVYDPDCPPIKEEDFPKFHRVNKKTA